MEGGTNKPAMLFIQHPLHSTVLYAKDTEKKEIIVIKKYKRNKLKLI